MGFRFSLEGLLRWRTTLEQLEERALLRLRQEERRLLGEVEQMAELRRGQRARRVAADGTLLGADLRFAAELGESLAREEEKMRQRWREKREETERQAAVLAGARRRREAMTALRERELRAYREGERRREQGVLDEMFLRGRGRKRGRDGGTRG